MAWNRWIIVGLPIALALLVSWAARQAMASRDLGGDEVVVASGEMLPVTLNPFLPVSTVDREVASMVHQGLFKLGVDGHIVGALAESWSWSQQTRFWFANELYAQKAEEKLKGLSPEQWAVWKLREVVSNGNELRLQLDAVSVTVGPAIHQLIAEFGPLPVETLRVELKPEQEARVHHEFFMSGSVEAAQVKAVKFESSNVYELQVSGETVKFFEELDKYYRNLPDLGARLRFVRRSPMQDRPTLEVVLREGALFHDASPVTGADVEATVKLVLEQGWPVDGLEGLRMIDAWDTSAPRRPRITLREVYGPVMMSLVDLPILPKRWVESYAARVAAGEKPFVDQPPVGAGAYQLDGDVESSLFVSRFGNGIGENKNGKRVQFLLDQSPAAIRAGFAMKRVDVFWPGVESVAGLVEEYGVKVKSTIPRNRLLVMWNCRKSPLDDVRVREALELGLDREALVQEWLQGQGAVVEGIFQPGVWFASQDEPRVADRAKAKEILYEAGWLPDDSGILVKGGGRLRFELLTVAGNEQRLRLAERLKELWQEMGVEVVVKALPWEEILEKQLPARQFDAVLMGLNFERSWDQTEFWHSNHSRKGMNLAGIEDGPVNTWLTSLRTEQEPQKVKELAKGLESRLRELHPFLPLFAGGSMVALREDVITSDAREDETGTVRQWFHLSDVLTGEGGMK